MSESEARFIINGKKIPWSDTGKNLYRDWRALERSENRDPDQSSISSFDRYVNDRISTGTLHKSPARAKKAKKNELEKATEKALASGSVLADEIEESVKEEEEKEKGDDLMAFAKTISDETVERSKPSTTAMARKCNPRPTRSLVRPNSSPKMKPSFGLSASGVQTRQSAQESAGEGLDKDPLLLSGEEEEESFEEDLLTSGHVMADNMLGVAIENLMEYSRSPVHDLHKMTTKSGQQLLKDQIRKCCLKTAQEDLRSVYDKGDAEDDFDPEKINKKGCDHFVTPVHSEKASIHGVSSIYSLLGHAEKDDAISSMIAKEALSQFIDIRDMAHALSCVDKSHMVHHFLPSEISPDYYMGKVMDVPVKRLSASQLRAIERNYRFIQATPWGSWGQLSLRKKPSTLSEDASGLSMAAMKWLADTKKKGGAKYDDAENKVFLGYHAMIAYLASVISYLPQNFREGEKSAKLRGTTAKDVDLTRQAVSRSAFEAVSFIRQALETGKFPEEILDYEMPGETESKTKRGRKTKKFVRRHGPKMVQAALRLFGKGELPVLKSVVKECSVFYGRQLADIRRRQAATGVKDRSKVSRADRLMAALGVISDVADKEAASAARRIGRMSITIPKKLAKKLYGIEELAKGDPLIINSSRFDVHDMTIKALAMTACHMASSGYGTYQPFTDANVRSNILMYIVTGAQKQAAEESGGKAPPLDFGKIVGYTPLVTQASEAKITTGLRMDTKTKPVVTKLSSMEHDAFVEAMLALRDHVSRHEKLTGRKRTGSSLPWSFIVVIPNEKKLIDARDRRRVYDNIHRYIFESKGSDGNTLKTIRGNHDPHSSLKVSGPIRLDDATGDKLKRWIQRKNVHVHLRKSIG